MSNLMDYARWMLASIDTTDMPYADREALRKVDVCLIGAGATATGYVGAMRALNNAAYAAVRAALKEDGAPVEALKEIAADIDSLVDCGMTRQEAKDARALYEGAKMAGLT